MNTVVLVSANLIGFGLFLASMCQGKWIQAPAILTIVLGYDAITAIREYKKEQKENIALSQQTNVVEGRYSNVLIRENGKKVKKGLVK